MILFYICILMIAIIGLFRQDILFSHSTPVKPGQALDRLMEKLDLTGLVGSPPNEYLPPSGKTFVQILLMFEVQRLCL